MKRSATRGFTLIETVLAMMILAGGIVVLVSSWSGSMLAIRKTRHANTAALLLQQKMTEFELKYEDKPLSEIKEEDSGDFGDEYSDFSWTMESQKLKMPDLSAGLASRDEGVGEIEMMIVKQLQTFIEKSVVELKVTVTRVISGKTLEYSATTYFVDYSANLAGAL